MIEKDKEIKEENGQERKTCKKAWKLVKKARKQINLCSMEYRPRKKRKKRKERKDRKACHTRARHGRINLLHKKRHDRKHLRKTYTHVHERKTDYSCV